MEAESADWCRRCLAHLALEADLFVCPVCQDEDERATRAALDMYKAATS